MGIIKNFFYQNKRGITFIILTLISILLLIFSNKKITINFRKILFVLTSPFEFFVTGTGNFFRDTVTSILELNKIKKELEKTKLELDQYKKIIIDFNELNHQLNTLKQILDLKNNFEYQTVTAEVIGRDPKKLNDFLIIDKGLNHGIKENMAVITYTEGKKLLVGKTVEVTPFYSKVMTLNNSNLHVGVFILDSRINCIVKGDNIKPNIIKLLYIPKEYKLSGVTYVYTSGDSLIYPKGIEVGEIVSIKESQRYENFNEGYVKISVELSKLEYVIVLKIESNPLNEENY